MYLIRSDHVNTRVLCFIRCLNAYKISVVLFEILVVSCRDTESASSHSQSYITWTLNSGVICLIIWRDVVSAFHRFFMCGRFHKNNVNSIECPANLKIRYRRIWTIAGAYWIQTLEDEFGRDASDHRNACSSSLISFVFVSKI